MKHTNQLIKESSPYLLQHAHNPVNWYAWNNETLELAKKENKIILVSIGYSACHWCHVMEHESFENEEVAAIMNQHFINVKVDREERPDVDMVYMGAVQLMTGQGGWPLNCFALPDGRPVYGGTYFPKNQWVNVLTNISDLYKTNPEKVFEYEYEIPFTYFKFFRHYYFSPFTITVNIIESTFNISILTLNPSWGVANCFSVTITYTNIFSSDWIITLRFF